MNSRAALFAGLFASVLATTSCGDFPERAPVSPVGPSSLSDLLVPRLGGNWGGELTLSGVTGGTGPAVNAGATWCEGADFARVLGEKNEYTMVITQDGKDLTVSMVSAANGLACDYTGHIGSENTFVLQSAECKQHQDLNFLCRDGSSRSLRLAGSSVTASFNDPINPTVITGRAAYTYNVEPNPGGTPPAALVATQSFSALTRR